MTDPSTPAYAIGYLREVEMNEDIVEYIERIDLTLAPYGGRFLVHGGRITAVEGTWDGDLVIIEFPDLAAARGWYEDPGYQEILPLRTGSSDSMTCLVPGVPPGYRAVDKLASLGVGATSR